MFVEQVTWNVSRGQEQNALRLLNSAAQQMDTSGGLVRSLVGQDVASEQRLISLNFWKSWEDLSRFLGKDSEFLRQSQQEIRLHHYETIWEWPDEEVATISGEAVWVIHDISAKDDEVESMLDSLRHLAPTIKNMQGFHTAALWMDKNNYGHIVFATQWAPNMPLDALQEQAKGIDQISPGKVRSVVCRLNAADMLPVG